MAKDPYSVLGVSKDAKDEDIQKAFRQNAKQYHPDLNPDDKKTEDKFKELNAAYDILGDSAKRARYDRGEIDPNGTTIRQKPSGHDGFRDGSGRDFADFSDLRDEHAAWFGGLRGARPGGGFQQQTAKHGEDVHLHLEVDFLDAVRGGTKHLTLPSGDALDVSIPTGVADGQTLRLKGQGTSILGGPPGDVLVEIKVREHPYFSRTGHNIRLGLPITLEEAVLGAKVDVPTIHGPVTVIVPKGANTGTMLRLKGKGIVSEGGVAGDQLVTMQVMLPPGDAELEEFVRCWGPKTSYNPRARLEK